MGPAALAQVLRPLTQRTHPDLLVGLQTSDDAAVFRLSADQAIIQTVDFFPPIVDDPFTYGAIAAANSMSDVYAMGGDVLLALNIAAFPDDLPTDLLTAIFEGGAAKVAEAGAIIAGGHTVTDAEPKYGLCVTGTIHPERVLTKAGARPGDRIFLTKPIGTGVITTALKSHRVDPIHIDAAIRSMLDLNRAASDVARAVGVHACTDITGFGLVGHASELAAKSNVALRLSADAVPILGGALEYARAGHLAGGLGRNREHFMNDPEGGVQLDSAISQELAALLFDPQTSGGLLLTLPAKRAPALRAAFEFAALPIWELGEVVPGAGIDVER